MNNRIRSVFSLELQTILNLSGSSKIYEGPYKKDSITESKRPTNKTFFVEYFLIKLPVITPATEKNYGLIHITHEIYTYVKSKS